MTRRPGLVILVTASLTASVASACAKPSTETGTTGSDAPDDRRVRVDAPVSGSCAPTRVREVRYASTLPAGHEVPAEIGALRCVENAYSKLEADIACAREFNQSSWAHALQAEGLVLEPNREADVWIEGAEFGGLEIGSVHPVPDEPDRRVVFLGVEADDCSGRSRYTASSGPVLARNGADELVVVHPRPDADQREYKRCSCFPGCGAMPQPWVRFVELPDGVRLGEPVEVVYPAISIVIESVESQTCCCAP